ncbi:MAG: YlmH/Sll1252 family protein [Finegoldia sp.]|nr:YlmH/Sll1252 family protein [Finegoldia sp.]
MNDLSYIRDEEIKNNIRRFCDILEIAKKNKQVNSTNFLNPKEIEYARKILDKEGQIDYIISNVPRGCEKSIIILWDNNIYDKAYIDQFDYLKLLKIDTNSNLSHRDVLGAALNLGISRDKIGDIFYSKGILYLTASPSLAKFLNLNLEKIKKDKVSTKIVDENVKKDDQEFESIIDVIQSNRLDLLVSAMASISRSDAKKLINSGKVKINYELADDASTKVKESSLVSIRGYGRFIYSKGLGMTKKDKLRIEYKKYL